ncbi:hypothetical protein QCA50_005698 [Cerrena zonata]|uniref:Uncharacterized protein n=1 Tax=Cerrena zonata TaxID=2478898 RepID=A0AAW0GFW2_9APHY
MTGILSVLLRFVNDRTIKHPRGKGLGGCSMINFFASVRPSKDELDAFENLGNPGWNWDSLLYYMKKSEQLQFPDISPEDSQHLALLPELEFRGLDGPLAKSFPIPNITDVHPKMMDALETLGVPRTLDGAIGRNVGATAVTTSIDRKTATRSYSASAYYAPNASRPNLLILTGANASKIHFTRNINGLQHAVSVEFVKDGVVKKVYARKEVIRSAGSLKIPQLLELSGIGNRAHLEPLGIETKIDLPGVGENLQDHVRVPTIIKSDERFPSREQLENEEVLEKQWSLYKEGKGMLAWGPSTFTAFIPAKTIANESDIQRWISFATLSSTPSITPHSVKLGFEKQFAIVQQRMNDSTHPVGQLLTLNAHSPVNGLEADAQKHYMSVLCACSNPLSRGTTHIASSDPMEASLIDPNYLSNPADVEILSQMVRFTLKLYQYQTEPFSDLVVGPVVPVFGQGEVDPETIVSHVRHTMETVCHPVGTASMLPLADGGVVDSELKVYGTSNLRVVDCSIIPLQVSSNIQALCYGIAEKAADLIKGANGVQ